jgi:hypothetical protein
MQNNYNILDGAVGTVAEHTTALSGKAPLVHTHTKSDVTDLFNSANTWTGNNTYSKTVTIERNTDAGKFLALKNSVAEQGSTPAIATPVTITYKDKNNDDLGYMGVYYDTDGSNLFRLYVINKFTSGAPSTSGTADYAYFGLKLNADKSKEGILKASFRPYDNNTYDLGSSSYQWNNLYAKNYYYNGTEFQNKFVTLDSTQTINYSKTFGSNAYLEVHGYRLRVINDDMEIGVVPTSNQWTGMVFTDKNKTNISEIIQSFQRNGNTLWQVIVKPNEANAQRKIILSYTYNSANNVNSFSVDSDFVPITSETYNLGTSNQKWKTLNGINPGALSLPGEYSSSVTEYITDKTGGNNAYTAPADGWVGIQANSATLDSTNFIFMGRISDGSTYYAQNASSPINSYWSNQYHGCILLPVIGGKTYGIRCKCDTVDARFYKANGNVS